MPQSYLVFDLETIPDPDLAFDAAVEGFPPPPFHQVVSLGVIWLDAHYRFKRMGTFGSGTEGEPGRTAVGERAPEASTEHTLLRDFARFVNKERPELITFNGRMFDLPVLVARMLKHAVPFVAYYSNKDYRYRYSDVGHIDLLDLLTEYGAARRSKLDVFAKLVGMPGKMDIDGSMVRPLYERGEFKKIHDYCLHDVVQTTFLFLRSEVLRGRISADDYTQVASALWEQLAADERVAEVFENADRNEVLLLRGG